MRENSQSGGLDLSVQPDRKHPHHKTPTASKHQIPLLPGVGLPRPCRVMAPMVLGFGPAFLRRRGLRGRLKLKCTQS